MQFVDVNGFENNYQISNNGDIKSKSTNTIIKKTLEKNGHYTVQFYAGNGKTIEKYIHELVAEHFLDVNNTNNKIVITKDGNKSNNNYANLEYAEASDDLETCHKKHQNIFFNMIKTIIF